MFDFITARIRSRSIVWRERIELLYAKFLQRTCKLPEVTLGELLSNVPAVLTPILDQICLPPYIENGLYEHDDYTPLMAIASAIKPRIIVEFGTAHGNTVANLCRHSAESTIYTVNAPSVEMTGKVTTFALTKKQIGSVYRGHGFGERVVQIYANTLKLDLTPFLQGQVIDLAIIDACHDTSYVLNDFNTLRPHMRAAGVVLFHDTHPSMNAHLVGSYRACMMLRRQGYDIKHIRGSWWGVWVNPSDS